MNIRQVNPVSYFGGSPLKAAPISLPREPWVQEVRKETPLLPAKPVRMERDWDADDIEKLKKLLAEGLSQSVIAYRMGRSRGSVSAKICRMKGSKQ